MTVQEAIGALRTYAEGYAGNIRGMCALAADLLESNVPRWINVKEQQPENNEPVLVSAEKQYLNGKVCNVVFTAFHTDGTTYAADGSVIPKAWWEDVHFGDECLMIPYYVKITHWMPLPKSAEVTHESQTN